MFADLSYTSRTRASLFLHRKLSGNAQKQTSTKQIGKTANANGIGNSFCLRTVSNNDVGVLNGFTQVLRTRFDNECGSQIQRKHFFKVIRAFGDLHKKFRAALFLQVKSETEDDRGRV